MTTESILRSLTTPGTKNKLQFPRELREQFERDCGFTDEELKIFRLRAKGMSVLQISFAMQTETELYGTEKVERAVYGRSRTRSPLQSNDGFLMDY